jgi:hypothetical protein
MPNISTKDSPRQKMIEDVRKDFASTMGKEVPSPATAIKGRRPIIVSLKVGTTQVPDTSKEVHQGEQSELSLITSFLVSHPIELHLRAQKR